MRTRTKRKRMVWMTSGVILASALLLYAFVFVNDKPGGLADWRMSHYMGLNGIIQIPLGKTPEDAVQQFRNYPSMQVIYREPIDGGILLFIKRFYQKDGNDLQVEYARKTWLGWKWGWGGGYGIGGSLQTKAALNYMSIPEVEGISTPFPIVFGDVLDPSVNKVTVETKGKDTGNYEAKLTDLNNENRIWFVLLPSADYTSFEIKGFNAEGKLIANKTVSDLRDSGSIDLSD